MEFDFPGRKSYLVEALYKGRNKYTSKQLTNKLENEDSSSIFLSGSSCLWKVNWRKQDDWMSLRMDQYGSKVRPLHF